MKGKKGYSPAVYLEGRCINMDIHIQCRLSVSGESDLISQFKDRVSGVYPVYEIGPGCPSCRIILEPEEPPKHVLCFNSLIPVPDGVLKHGYPKAGIYWEINNWGIKWGAGDDEIIEETDVRLAYKFWTPSAIPRKWVKTASHIFPDFKFVLAYFGKECRPFWGIEVYKGGSLREAVEIPHAVSEKMNYKLSTEWERAVS